MIRCYGEFLTRLYIENHLKPLRAFCRRHGFTLRAQTSYGEFLELEQTAGYPDIPDTETLYGKDILDFYRAQAGAAHIAGRSIYAIEAVKLTEPVVMPLPDNDGMLCDDAIPKIAALLPKMDAVLFGSGSGIGPGTE